jgi:hypothetical protein
MPIEDTAAFVGNWSSSAASNKPTDNPGKRIDGAGEIRQLKKVIKDSFPNVSGAVTRTQQQLNAIDITTSLSDALAAKATISYVDTQIASVSGAAVTQAYVDSADQTNATGIATNAANILSNDNEIAFLNDVVGPSNASFDSTGGGGLAFTTSFQTLETTEITLAKSTTSVIALGNLYIANGSVETPLLEWRIVQDPFGSPSVISFTNSQPLPASSVLSLPTVLGFVSGSFGVNEVFGLQGRITAVPGAGTISFTSGAIAVIEVTVP